MIIQAWQNRSQAFRGMIWGGLGVLSFSLTLPATRLAVQTIDTMIVGLGRGLVAGVLAALVLCISRQAWPNKGQWRQLMLVALGVVWGFPLFSAWAMHRVPASHGAVVLGLLPLATALAARLRAHERPSVGFWIASGVGSSTVILFALHSGGGQFQPADLALLAAVACAAFGYAEGGRLARTMGGWQVICWALVLSLPGFLPVVGWRVYEQGFAPSAISLAGLAYLSLFSMFLGFFAWYHGLVLGGVARVSQLQLLQPFLSLGFAALLLGEQIEGLTVFAALVVGISIMIGRRTRVVTAVASGGLEASRSVETVAVEMVSKA